MTGEYKVPVEITLSDGKYTFKIDSDRGVLACLRYGKPWREFIGDHAVHSLYDHAVAIESGPRYHVVERRSPPVPCSNPSCIPSRICHDTEWVPVSKPFDSYGWATSFLHEQVGAFKQYEFRISCYMKTSANSSVAITHGR